MTQESRADTLFFFLRKRGLGPLSVVMEHLNSGASQKSISVMLDMDEGQLSRFIGTVFVREYHVRPEIADMIDVYEQLERRNAERVRGNVHSMGERHCNVAGGDAAGVLVV